MPRSMAFKRNPRVRRGSSLRFHLALETGAALSVTLRDARASLELVTVMYCSARTGLAVRLPIRSSDADDQKLVAVSR